MKHQYSIEMRAKGWTAMSLANRWGLSKQGVAKMVANPTPRDWDALQGLPDLTRWCERRSLRVWTD